MVAQGRSEEPEQGILRLFSPDWAAVVYLGRPQRQIEPRLLAGGHVEGSRDRLAASIVTLHAPLPLHAPLQPVKVEPVAAVAVSVTTVP